MQCAHTYTFTQLRSVPIAQVLIQWILRFGLRKNHYTMAGVRRNSLNSKEQGARWSGSWIKNSCNPFCGSNFSISMYRVRTYVSRMCISVSSNGNDLNANKAKTGKNTTNLLSLNCCVCVSVLCKCDMQVFACFLHSTIYSLTVDVHTNANTILYWK